MSKKSVVARGFGWKLAAVAVAAAVVVGVAVGVFATPPTQSSGAAAKTLTAAWEVLNIAELDVTSGDLADEALICSVLVVSAANFGNLGTIRVKTNATRWDVQMTTENGGRLRETKTGGKWDYETNILGIVTDSTWIPDVGNEYLKYGGVDSVTLDVAIGVAKSGTGLGINGAVPNQLYPLISNNVVVKPVKIDSVDLRATQRSLASPVPVSFADSIGGKYTSGVSGTFQNGIYGGGTSGVDAWGTIQSDGFPIPKGNELPMEEYFYVNVGIPEAKARLIEGNKDGNYTETFRFELMANF